MERLALTALSRALLELGCSGQSSAVSDTPKAVRKFPKLTRSTSPLVTRDDGNCDHALAAQYGGECDNFHWLGLMGDPFVVFDGTRFRMWFSAGQRVGAAMWIRERGQSAGVAYFDPWQVRCLLWRDSNGRR